ncbi:glycosyltransferase family 4 protein [Roseofilum sp. BLCC_M154]|uniref:Glycosyltransferase family 4 protein n=1 Tax=Roseofilum acuticapitatum BLCC-M154 TaxID=3022444 RepID=A0ABT7AQ47_9CYAN|nr:glycosyltransferase family 4 protein [Roseofilum acuticapitatum]MDJ1169010.1 glycosyltransferase family 4 protein [Roseofilum acuticapitatum BLCC-M154]
MKLLFISSPVSSLNSGRLGGVALNLKTIATEMSQRGHQIQIIAPTDSTIASLPIKEIPGELQPLIPEPTYNDPVIIPNNSVLANMWDYAHQVQADYDLIIDFGYEWLPFYLSPFFKCPVLHYVCIGSWTGVMDRAIERVAHLCPGTLGAHTKAQAATYSVAESFRILGGAIDLTQYQFCPEPGNSLAWAGRISAEKGLEDAVAAAQKIGIHLQVFGYLQDPEYWQQICQDYPQASLEYMGFLPTQDFQSKLGKCRALLMTHKWVEAFGRVALEALACGVPVISYRRGGPSEIVVDGQTGWLVEPDNLDELVRAIKNINKIDRHQCRQRAETEYSLPGFGDRLEQWFQDVL